MKRIFKLNPEKNLIEQPIFILVNSLVLTAAIILYMIILSNGNYEWKLTADGCKFFLESFKLPISISAIVIPVSALIATMHRSTQLTTQLALSNKQLVQQLELSNKQIGLLMNQNNFANYYKHYEEFEKYLINKLNQSQLQVIKDNTLVIYRAFYPDTRSGNFNPSLDLLKGLDELAGLFVRHCDAVKNTGGDLWNLFEIALMIQNRFIVITGFQFERIQLDFYDNKYARRNEDIKGAFNHLLKVIQGKFLLAVYIIDFEKIISNDLEKINSVFTASVKKLIDYEQVEEIVSDVEFKTKNSTRKLFN